MTDEKRDTATDAVGAVAGGLSRREILKFSLRGAGAAATAGFLTALPRGRAAAAAGAARSENHLVVETTEGKVRGLATDEIFVFKGIHYGASTAGPNRFLPPRLPESWTGVRDMFEYGPSAPQLPATSRRALPITAGYAYGKTLPMNEDCLALNVFTPATDRGKRPVMVWLHGGQFTYGQGGNSVYDGTNLARRHDVVAVSLNHRLNLFGFMQLEEVAGREYAASGNASMLDLIAALQWVHDNISAFGGDPGNVTIFGESGGGGKVTALLAMPKAKGLFHKAIVESGSFIRMMPQEEAAKNAEKVLAQLGVKGNPIEQLQQFPMERLIEASRDAQWQPVVDGRLLPRHPFEPTAPDVSEDVPLLVGSNETETTFFMGGDDALFSLDEAELRTRLKPITGEATEEVIAVYRKARPNATPSDLFFVITSDQRIRMGAITQAERKSALGRAPAYAYFFAWKAPIDGGKWRTPHTLELPFVFETYDKATVTSTGPERKILGDRVSGAWAAFARNGSPNCKGLPEWNPYTPAERATLIFDNECRVVNDPNHNELQAIRGIRRL
ncbi:MAG TPA: carboxylesterase/lipase family protein [Candidatus Acidoferrales bacterium]|nr:carboxylesterase/lipase family protein [Candidatus Acidoferrales bacterium]